MAPAGALSVDVCQCLAGCLKGNPSRGERLEGRGRQKRVWPLHCEAQRITAWSPSPRSQSRSGRSPGCWMGGGGVRSGSGGVLEPGICGALGEEPQMSGVSGEGCSRVLWAAGRLTTSGGENRGGHGSLPGGSALGLTSLAPVFHGAACDTRHHPAGWSRGNQTAESCSRKQSVQVTKARTLAPKPVTVLL